MHRAFTLVETAVATAALGTAAALLQPVAAGVGQPSLRFHDAEHLKILLEAHMLWAGMNGGAYPLPGDVDTMGTTIDVGQFADPDAAVRLNTTGNTWSILIFNGLITPQDIVSPAETNGLVGAYDAYEYRNPECANDPDQALWDPCFHGTPLPAYNFDNQDNPSDVGNNSYAQNPALGVREPFWMATGDPDQVVLGNRGPIYEGNAVEGWVLVDGPGGNESNSLDFYAKDAMWRGNIAYNDGRVEFETSPAPDDLLWTFPELPDGRNVYPDNVFHNEDMSGDEQSENANGLGQASVSGYEFFDDPTNAGNNAYLRPVAGVSGSAGNLGTVTLWID